MKSSGSNASKSGGWHRSARQAGRRAQFDPGRWLLERQRFGLPAHAKPRPPERMVPISAVIPALVEKVQNNTHLHVEALRKIWPEVAGASVSAHAQPGRLEEGMLVIFVDHSIWLSEIQRYHAITLLQRLQRVYPQGRIRRLVFRLNPERTGKGIA